LRDFFEHFFKDRAFFHQFTAILVPIALQNLIMVGVSMADTMMVGSLGDVRLSSVALANQFGFILHLFLFGLVGGSNVMIAQFWGKGDTESIQRVMTVMYRFVAAASLIFSLLAFFFSGQVMAVFSVNPDVIASGAGYLRILGLGFILQSFAAATLMTLRSVSKVGVSMIVYLCSLLTNVFFNWVFIFGNLGAPALGVRGAAIATVLSRVTEIILVLVYMSRFEKLIRYKLRMLFAGKLGIMKSFVKNAMPVMFNELLWGLGASTIAVIIGRLGTEFTAAHSVTSVLSQFVSVAIFGSGSASAVIIGNTVGSGDYLLARQRASKLIYISLLLGFIAMGLTLLLRTPLLTFYNISAISKAYARQFMTAYAFIALFQSFNMIALVGVLRGGGDGRFVMFVDVLSIWFIAIPLGYLSGHVWGWPAVAVFAMIRSDEVIKSVFTLPRLLKGKWVKDVTLETASAGTAADAGFSDNPSSS